MTLGHRNRIRLCPAHRLLSFEAGPTSVGTLTLIALTHLIWESVRKISILCARYENSSETELSHRMFLFEYFAVQYIGLNFDQISFGILDCTILSARVSPLLMRHATKKIMIRSYTGLLFKELKNTIFLNNFCLTCV